MAGIAYQWGHWRFEPTESRLLRDGTVVALPGKTLHLLATLLRRAPRLVTKEEILTAVWPDAIVEEGNIAFHITALRKAIDEGRDVSAIETVRGRGYRFVHEFSIHEMQPTELLHRDAVERGLVASAPPATVIPEPTPEQPDATFPATAGMKGMWIAVGLLAVVVTALAIITIIVWRQS